MFGQLDLTLKFCVLHLQKIYQYVDLEQELILYYIKQNTFLVC